VHPSHGQVLGRVKVMSIPPLLDACAGRSALGRSCACTPSSAARATDAPSGRRGAPVSERAGSGEVVCFNAASRPIHPAPALDALLDFRCESGTLRLHDVVASSRPTLADDLAALGRRVEGGKSFSRTTWVRRTTPVPGWCAGRG